MQLTDLIVGSEYRFRIKAENAYGVSEAGGESQQVLIEEAKSTEGYGNHVAIVCFLFIVMGMVVVRSQEQ